MYDSVCFNGSVVNNNNNKLTIKEIAYLSHPLQKKIVACLGMPSDMSMFVRRHATHMFEGLGSMGTAHWQHNLERLLKINDKLLMTESTKIRVGKFRCYDYN